MKLYLTKRELEVMSACAEGLPHKVVAVRTGITLQGVMNRLTQAKARNGLKTTLQMMVEAARQGLI